MSTEHEPVAIIGMGLVGASWAAFFTSKGYKAKVYDVDRAVVEEGHKNAISHLEFLKDHLMISHDTFHQAVHDIEPVDSLQEAVEQVDFIVEAASERYDVKKRLFKEIDASCSSDIIIASSSSALLMTEIQSDLGHPERTMIAHPFNPVHLVPLVELVGGKKTDKAYILKAKIFFEHLGKIVVVVRKEVPGFIANRLQSAIWREAVDMVLKGIGTVEDIDKALYAGPGIRYALMGQHLIYHLGGGKGGIEHFIDHIGKTKSRIWEDIATWTTFPEEAKELLARGTEEEIKGRDIEDIKRWRDEKLVELIKLIYGEDHA